MKKLLVLFALVLLTCRRGYGIETSLTVDTYQPRAVLSQLMVDQGGSLDLRLDVRENRMRYKELRTNDVFVFQWTTNRATGPWSIWYSTTNNVFQGTALLPVGPVGVAGNLQYEVYMSRGSKKYPLGTGRIIVEKTTGYGDINSYDLHQPLNTDTVTQTGSNQFVRVSDLTTAEDVTETGKVSTVTFNSHTSNVAIHMDAGTVSNIASSYAGIQGTYWGCLSKAGPWPSTYLLSNGFSTVTGYTSITNAAVTNGHRIARFAVYPTRIRQLAASTIEITAYLQALNMNPSESVSVQAGMGITDDQGNICVGPFWSDAKTLTGTAAQYTFRSDITSNLVVSSSQGVCSAFRVSGVNGTVDVVLSTEDGRPLTVQVDLPSGNIAFKSDIDSLSASIPGLVYSNSVSALTIYTNASGAATSWWQVASGVTNSGTFSQGAPGALSASSATNKTTRLFDVSQPTRYFTALENGTGTVYEITGPFTNFAVTLSSDFLELDTNTRPAWTNNVFPFTDGAWNGFETGDSVYITHTPGGVTGAMWAQTGATYPATLVSAYLAAGSASVVVSNVYYTTNAIRHFATEAELTQAKAECGTAMTNLVIAATNALMPYTQTVYGDFTTTNEVGYAAFVSANPPAACAFVIVPASTPATNTCSVSFPITGQRINQARLTGYSRTLSGTTLAKSMLSYHDASGKMILSNEVDMINGGLGPHFTNTLNLAGIYATNGWLRATYTIGATSGVAKVVYAGATQPMTLSVSRVPTPYATVGELAAYPTFAQVTNIAQSVGVTFTNGTTMADGVYNTTNGVFFTRDGTNHWILF